MVNFQNIDCAKLLETIPDNSIDLFLEDMPFNTTACGFEYAVDLQKYWADRLNKVKDNGTFVLFGTGLFAYKLALSNEKMFRYDLIWEKTAPVGFLNSKIRPLRNHEIILVFSKKVGTYNPQFQKGEPYKKIREVGSNIYHGQKEQTLTSNNTGDRHPKSVICYSNGNNSHDTGRVIHPTQKPLPLIKYLIRTFSNEGDTIFDGFSGSGTTAVASIIEKRNFIGSEIDSKYFEAASKRIENEQKKLCLF